MPNSDETTCEVYECRDRAQFRLWRDRLPCHFDHDGEPIVCPAGTGIPIKICGTHHKRWGDWEHVIGVQRLPWQG